MAPDSGEGHDNTTVLELDYKSCEMIAEELYLQINFKYPNRKVTIEVSEDGENGCEITWEK
jgi:tRNA isopentenyl-2-thiomethyl-A-37 hydroxylase MiaE